ncbi:RxLR effector protein [Phytophthora megakarya]|uniref:RxLR effector protein n=1 Tax=Phytophthora megakarya TaxID=4795 RepID=A0A225W3Y5_9STRA|nr:RxLR effector protein [Phytophthora megakarya]
MRRYFTLLMLACVKLATCQALTTVESEMTNDLVQVSRIDGKPNRFLRDAGTEGGDTEERGIKDILFAKWNKFVAKLKSPKTLKIQNVEKLSPNRLMGGGHEWKYMPVFHG